MCYLLPPCQSQCRSCGPTSLCGTEGQAQGGDVLPGVLGQPTYHLQPGREGRAGPPAAATTPWQPANFSFLPGQTADWFQCQAANSVNVQHSALTLVPPGERALGFPEGQLALLCWEGASVQDTGRWEVGQLYPATAESTEGTGGNHAHPGPCLKEAQPSCLRPAPRRVAQSTHHCAGWQPRLHCGRHLRDAGLDHVDQVGNGCWMQGGGRAADGLRGSAGLWLGSSGGGACRAGLWPGQRRAVTAYARLEGVYEDLPCVTCLLRLTCSRRCRTLASAPSCPVMESAGLWEGSL